MPTEYESGFYNTQPKENRGSIATRWYTVNCVKAGWMEKTASLWRITEEGRKAYVEFTDPLAFAQETARRYNEWKSSKRGEEPSSLDAGELESASSMESPASLTLETAEEDAWSEIQRYLTTMDPFEFQDLVAAVLRTLDYHIAYVSPPGPDRGLDILAFTDPLGASGPRIKVQVKRRQDKTTVDGIRWGDAPRRLSNEALQSPSPASGQGQERHRS